MEKRGRFYLSRKLIAVVLRLIPVCDEQGNFSSDDAEVLTPLFQDCLGKRSHLSYLSTLSKRGMIERVVVGSRKTPGVYRLPYSLVELVEDTEGVSDSPFSSPRSWTKLQREAIHKASLVMDEDRIVSSVQLRQIAKDLGLENAYGLSVGLAKNGYLFKIQKGCALRPGLYQIPEQILEELQELGR